MLKFRRLHLDHSFTITVSRAPVVITLILEYLSFLFSSLSSCFFFSPRFFPRPHSFLVLFVVLQGKFNSAAGFFFRNHGEGEWIRELHGSRRDRV